MVGCNSLLFVHLSLLWVLLLIIMEVHQSKELPDINLDSSIFSTYFKLALHHFPPFYVKYLMSVLQKFYI
jgi:hypothetical protein